MGTVNVTGFQERVMFFSLENVRPTLNPDSFLATGQEARDMFDDTIADALDDLDPMSTTTGTQPHAQGPFNSDLTDSAMSGEIILPFSANASRFIDPSMTLSILVRFGMPMTQVLKCSMTTAIMKTSTCHTKPGYLCYQLLHPPLQGISLFSPAQPKAVSGHISTPFPISHSCDLKLRAFPHMHFMWLNVRRRCSRGMCQLLLVLICPLTRTLSPPTLPIRWKWKTTGCLRLKR